MSPIFTAIEHLALSQILMPAARPSGSRMKDAIMVLSFVLLCIGIGFILYGTSLWFMTRYSTDIALLLTGGVALLFGAAAFCGVQGFFYYKAWRMKQVAAHIAETAEDLLKDVVECLEKPVQDNPKTAVLIAAAAGYLATERLSA